MSAKSLELVAEVSRVGASPPRLVIEVPHGATRREEFDELARRLESRLPAGLLDSFFIGTDAGAPELALAIAAQVVALAPGVGVLVVRSRIPRTFVDCNRLLSASRRELAAAKLTPALMPWVTRPADRALLVQRHRAYLACVDAALAEAAGDGAMLQLHTYAPREVAVDVGPGIDPVAALREAWRDEARWPLRAEVDFIVGRPAEALRLRASRSAQGRGGAPLGVLSAALRAAGVEVRRDLLADWQPFVDTRVDSKRCARLARPFAEGLVRGWFSGRR